MSVPVCQSPQSFSAAASVAPIKMWSSAHQGNVYLCVKNSFLDFYDDEMKEVKRSAITRSCSADSSISKCTRGREAAMSASTRSPSPSTRDDGDAESVESLTQRAQPQVLLQRPIRPSAEVPKAALPDLNVLVEARQVMLPTHAGHAEAQARAEAPQNFISISDALFASKNLQNMQEVGPKSASNRDRDDELRRKLDLSKNRTSLETEAKVTTVMIRGIPCGLTKDRLMEIMDQAGLAGKYDFFYLPMAGSPGSANGNLGYAFVNFVHAMYVTHVKDALDGVALDSARSSKICKISAADIQGLRNLRKHFRRTAVSRSGQGPIFLNVKDRFPATHRFATQ